jgi:circadian clock protein KaiC
MEGMGGAARGLSTGLAALDDILAGGYARERVHLVEGRPGSGKTTLALQFLAAGSAVGDRGMYITLSESREELLHVAGTHGLDLAKVEICELVPPELTLDANMEQTVVFAADLELNETINLVMKAVAAIDPTRVVFDSLSEIRLLAQDPLRYRRQVLALKHFFTQRGCTVLFLDDVTGEDEDVNLHSLVHGVIRLEQTATSYGAERRRLRVFKMRARAFTGGFHDYKIVKGGVRIFARLVAADFNAASEDKGPASSALAELDALIGGGGLDRGTNTLIVGPSGIGKSTLAMQFVTAALARGEKALFLSFEETTRNFHRRNMGLGIDTRRATDSGQLIFRTIDPAELTPGELTEQIREHVESGVCTVVLDSLTGYQHAMPEEKFLLLQMHELLTYLNQRNVLTFLVLAQGGMVGEMRSPFELTYLADSVMLLRYFEAGGRVRRAMSMMKRRTGSHETTLREFQIDDTGIHVGPVLTEFSGILTGVPQQHGAGDYDGGLHHLQQSQ